MAKGFSIAGEGFQIKQKNKIVCFSNLSHYCLDFSIGFHLWIISWRQKWITNFWTLVQHRHNHELHLDCHHAFLGGSRIDFDNMVSNEWNEWYGAQSMSKYDIDINEQPQA